MNAPAAKLNDADDHPPRYSRKWFGEIFFGFWSSRILLHLATEIFDLNRDAVVYKIIDVPLAIGFIAFGIPWLVLTIRDLVEGRHPLRQKPRPRPIAQLRLWLPTIGAVLGVVLLVFWLQKILS